MSLNNKVNLPNNETFNEKMQKVNAQLERLNNRLELIEKVDALPSIDGVKYKVGSKVKYVYDNNVYVVDETKRWVLYTYRPNFYTKEEVERLIDEKLREFATKAGVDYE